MSFLRDKHALLLTVVLLLQAAVYYAASSRREIIPNVAPLATFPSALGRWHMIAEDPLTDDPQAVLQADSPGRAKTFRRCIDRLNIRSRILHELLKMEIASAAD